MRTSDPSTLELVVIVVVAAACGAAGQMTLGFGVWTFVLCGLGGVIATLSVTAAIVWLTEAASRLVDRRARAVLPTHVPERPATSRATLRRATHPQDSVAL